MNFHSPHVAICKFLGIDPADIVSTVLTATVDEIPTVTIVKQIIDDSELTEVTERFELTLIEEPEDDDGDGEVES